MDVRQCLTPRGKVPSEVDESHEEAELPDLCEP